MEAEAIAAEVGAILEAGGFRPMPAGEMKGLYAKACAGGWWMGGLHGGNAYSKHTAISPDTTYDPIEAARELVAHVTPKPVPLFAESLGSLPENDEETVSRETVEPAPVADPMVAAFLARIAREAALGPAPEPEHTGAHEAHGETGAEAGATEDQVSARLEQGDASVVVERSDSQGEVWDRSDGLGDAALDADFTDSPLLEFTEEMAEAEAQAEPSVAHMYGDSLHVMRLAKIGAVTRHARLIAPHWTTDHDAALRELRNFVMGVSENRWADDPARQAELALLEGVVAHMNAIVAARDVKVEFLEAASREEVEAFDPEAEWP